jgi:hypothetical protein
MWLFQSNPQLYRLLDSLADARLEEDVWKVSRFKREICSGDIALIWQCGRMEEKGIYAVVDVTSNVQRLRDSPESTQYWIRESDRNQTIDRVRIHRSLNMRIRLLSEEYLVGIPQFRIEHIFGKVRHHTNFEVVGNEREIILDSLNRLFGYVP